MQKWIIIPIVFVCAYLVLFPHDAFADTLTWYNLTLESSTVCLNNGGITVVGEQVNSASSILYQKAINGITMKLHRNNSPVGNYIIGVWSNGTVPSASNYIYKISTNDSATLTTTSTYYTFTNLTASHVMQLGEVLGVFYTTSNSPNQVCTRFNNYVTIADSYDGYNTRFQRYNAGWGGTATQGFNDIPASIFITDSTPTPPGNIVNGVDCDDPINAQTLLCRMAEIAGNPLTGASQTVGESFSDMFNQVGLIDTQANPDIKTNGVGYIMTVVALGVMVGMFWVAGRGDLTTIPTFVWFIGTIGILGLMTAIEYIDPTFLIIGIITVMAFAVAKARNVFGGQTLFTGESG